MRTAYGRTTNGWVLVGVAGLHAIAVLTLLSIEPVAEAVGLPKPLMVSLLATAPEPPPEPPKPLPPRPRVMPQPEPARLPPPVLALPETSAIARPVEAPPMPPEPLPAVLPPPAPELVKPVAAYTPPAPAPAPAPVVPPRFDADYLDNPAPAYPSLSRRLGEEGRVLLRVFVDPDGSPARVEVRDSSGFDRLDKVARDTVSRWRFVPARQGDKTVGAWVLVPISFSLRS